MTINIETVTEILKHTTLSAKQIATLTGQSEHMARKLRSIVINQYNHAFPYSTGASVRTDHFVKYYDNPIITKIFNEIFDLNNETNTKTKEGNDMKKFALEEETNYNDVQINGESDGEINKPLPDVIDDDFFNLGGLEYYDNFFDLENEEHDYDPFDVEEQIEEDRNEEILIVDDEEEDRDFYGYDRNGNAITTKEDYDYEIRYHYSYDE